MKKRIAKQIRDFAKQLPQSIEVQMKPRMYSGAEMIEKGIKLKDGSEIDPKAPRGAYSRLEPMIKPLNHERKLKKHFKVHGKNFIKAYMDWFIPYHKVMKAKWPGVFEKREVVKEESKQTQSL